MNMTFKDYVQAAIETVQHPKAGARRVMAAKLSRVQRWETLILVLVVGVIFAETTVFINGTTDDLLFGGPVFDNPVILGAIQMFFLFVMVNAIYFVGRRAGGYGGYDDSILLVAWLQFILIGVQVLQTLAFIFVPAVGVLIGLASVVLFFWLLTNFIAELHGFNSRGNVFAVSLVFLLGFAVLLSFILSALGFQIAG